jgi:hypothetical protein
MEEPHETSLGGLALLFGLLRKLRFAEAFSAVRVLKIRQGYSEAHHLLHLLASLFVGGDRLEDVDRLRDSEAYHRLAGVEHVSHATTIGDFLRRFTRSHIKELRGAMWQMQELVWDRLPKPKRRQATLDLDSRICPVYGNKKRGADFSFKKVFSYHPEFLSLAETGEWLDGVNRPGNGSSGSSGARLLRANLKRVLAHFATVTVRGDTKFGRIDVLEVCRGKARVCLGWASHGSLVAEADALPESSWSAFERPNRRRSRSRRRNVRRLKARRRGYKDKKLKQEMVAEFPYLPAALRGKGIAPYRMIVVRKRILTRQKGALFDVYDHFFYLTDIPRAEMTAEKIVRFANRRCNQENLIEQAKNGVGAFRMPTGNLLANDVFMLMALLAHNCKNWICLLGLGADKLTWEWKRFRMHFVYFTVRVIKRHRQLWIRTNSRWPDHDQIIAGMRRLAA